MIPQTKNQVLAKLRFRYARAGLAYKSKLIDQVVTLFDLHRKSAIRALLRPPPAPATLRRIGVAIIMELTARH